MGVGSGEQEGAARAGVKGGAAAAAGEQGGTGSSTGGPPAGSSPSPRGVKHRTHTKKRRGGGFRFSFPVVFLVFLVFFVRAMGDFFIVFLRLS